VRKPDNQRAIPFLGELYRIRVSGADTAGRFAVLDTEGQRGHGSLMHVHRHDSEVFLVLSSTLRVVVDGREHEAGEASAAGRPAGRPAGLPAGRSHGFVIVIPTARYLTLHHGPTFEQLAAAAVGEGDDIPDPARLTAIAAEHGIDGPLLLP
jgi:quercetin dioxygenase-like cupin family protein